MARQSAKVYLEELEPSRVPKAPWGVTGYSKIIPKFTGELQDFPEDLRVPRAEGFSEVSAYAYIFRILQMQPKAPEGSSRAPKVYPTTMLMTEVEHSRSPKGSKGWKNCMEH